jgi:hypothetical protein
MRFRHLFLGAAVVALFARCGLDRASDSSGIPAVLSLSLRGDLPPRYHLFASNLAVEKVRLALVRRPSDTLATLTKALPLDSTSVRFSVGVTLAGQAESLLAVLQYQTAQGVTLFSGQVVIEARVTGSASTTPAVPLSYTGPGGNIAALNLSPLDSVLSAGDSLEFLATAIDSNQQPVSSFYASWSTSDARVTINALGLVRAPDITKKVDITAVTPNGAVAQTTLTIQGSFALGISPDSVEKLPGGQQQFTVAVGPVRAGYIWSVNGVDGGNATFGVIDSSGFYTAPGTVPNPSSFQVCARVVAAPTPQNGCATVVISAVPSAGGDVIVINDQNIFDLSPMRPDSFPGNARMVRNLVNFQSAGIRNNGRVVYYDRGRNSPCFINLECANAEKARFDSVVSAQGFQVVKFDTLTTFTAIPANVKILVLWMPLVSYGRTEINAFKSFASQGGRIIFIGERLGFYTQTGIDIQNQFLVDMGAQLTNIGADWDCGYVTIPSGSIRSHQVTTGVNSVRIACASEMQLGPNDAPLFYDTSNTHLLAGVAKIDFTPLPAGPERVIRGAPIAGVGGER